METSNRSVFALTDAKTLISAFAGVLLLVVGLLPVVLSFDYGGCLAWTQYCAAMGVVTVAIATLVYLILTRRVGEVSQPLQLLVGYVHKTSYWLASLTLLWCGYIALQTIELPADIASLASQGAAEARTTWVKPLFRLVGQAAPERYPISINVESTKRVFAFLLTLPPLIWVVTELTRKRVATFSLLAIVALGTATHAAYGLTCLVFPNNGWIESAAVPNGFGRFVNRNNASLLLSLGVGASLSLAVSRLSFILGDNSGNDKFEFSDLFDAFCDLKSWIAIICLTINIAGILACGSRGGLLAMAFGMLVALGWGFRFRKASYVIAAIGFPLALMMIVLLAPTVGLKSLNRMNKFEPRALTKEISKADRIGHWKDGMTAALNYCPAGSGAGTYGFAYLPYQQSGRELWFHHADNLWLELAVEQGFPGLLFGSLIAASLMIYIRRLNRSADVVDHAFGIMGIYILTSTAISQFFDFGLMLPANGYLFTILLAAIASRSRAVLNNHSQLVHRRGEPRRVLRRVFTHPLAKRLLVGTLTIAAVLYVLPILRESAESELILGQAKYAYQREKLSVEKLAARIDSIQKQIDQRPDEKLLIQASICQFQLARMKEIELLGVTTPAEFSDAYNRNKRGNRLFTELDQRARPWYESAECSSLLALRLNPLSIDARAQLLYLDFLNRDRGRTRILLEQLVELQKRNGPQLIRLARLAVSGGEPSLLEKATSLATSLDPSHVPESIDLVLQCKGANLDQALGDSPVVRRVAVTHVARIYGQQANRREELDTFIRHSLPLFRCDECETLVEKAKCERLAGMAYIRLSEVDSALARFRNAAHYQPANPALRVEYVRQLLRNRKYKPAFLESQRGIELFPSDDRFRGLATKAARLSANDMTDQR